MRTKIYAHREHTISCGHRVAGHESKCANLHGHNYTIEITMDGELDDLGRVLDFGVMKELFVGYLEYEWDHKFLFWENDPLLNADNTHLLKRVEKDGRFDGRFVEITPWWSELPGIVLVPFNPTAENMAEYLLNTAFPKLLLNARITSARVVKVTVHETPKCSATAINTSG